MAHSERETTVFDLIRSGLEDSIAYSRGERSLKTTMLPAPPPRARPADVLRLRRRLRMSQAVFAGTLNISPRTVQSWEAGARQPSDAALRLLQVINEHPEIVGSLLRVSSSAPRTRSPRRRRRAAVRRTPAR